MKGLLNQRSDYSDNSDNSDNRDKTPTTGVRIITQNNNQSTDEEDQENHNTQTQIRSRQPMPRMYDISNPTKRETRYISFEQLSGSGDDEEQEEESSAQTNWMPMTSKRPPQNISFVRPIRPARDTSKNAFAIAGGIHGFFGETEVEEVESDNSFYIVDGTNEDTAGPITEEPVVQQNEEESLIELIQKKLSVTLLSEVNTAPLYKQNQILPWTYDMQSEVDGYVAMGFLASAPRRAINCLRRRGIINRPGVLSDDLSKFIGDVHDIQDVLTVIGDLLMISVYPRYNVSNFLVEKPGKPAIFRTSNLEPEKENGADDEIMPFVKGTYTHVLFKCDRRTFCDCTKVPDSFGYCYKGQEFYDAVEKRTLPDSLNKSLRTYLKDPSCTMRFELCWLLLNRSTDSSCETNSCFLVVRKGPNEFYMMESGTVQLIGNLSVLRHFKIVYACYSLV